MPSHAKLPWQSLHWLCRNIVRSQTCSANSPVMSNNSKTGSVGNGQERSPESDDSPSEDAHPCNLTVPCLSDAGITADSQVDSVEMYTPNVAPCSPFVLLSVVGVLCQLHRVHLQSIAFFRNLIAGVSWAGEISSKQTSSSAIGQFSVRPKQSVMRLYSTIPPTKIWP